MQLGICFGRAGLSYVLVTTKWKTMLKLKTKCCKAAKCHFAYSAETLIIGEI